MVLSVIIVHYRVRYFLELCLSSVQKALAGFEAEVIVVDNDSGDGSIEALRASFPMVRFIENAENVGFARANNQALREALGDYVLFLNPDTVLPEDFVRVCLDLLRGRDAAGDHGAYGEADARGDWPAGVLGDRPVGAVGVRMVDGGGRYLPESRRGFPTSWVAFCKLFGLSALFPRSRVFARYYLGHLPADRSSPAPVLSGACMLVHRSILTGIGGFDERFFMYAEDIDLSYRIEKAGYVNYYFADTTIIHFKGESTQKDIRYIRQFYTAMSQFRRKHFDNGLPAVFNWGVEVAIRLRAGVGRFAAGHKSEVPVPTLRAWVTGDRDEALRVRALLGPGVVADPAEANGSLLCEGPGFSFRECINVVAGDGGRGKRSRVLFHAAGTRSAVGSPDRDGRGETLVF